MKIEIELHGKTDIPERHVYKSGSTSAWSVPVYAIDENGEPASLYFNFPSGEWEDLAGYEIGEIDFKWFYVPKALR